MAGEPRPEAGDLTYTGSVGRGRGGIQDTEKLSWDPRLNGDQQVGRGDKAKLSSFSSTGSNLYQLLPPPGSGQLSESFQSRL